MHQALMMLLLVLLLHPTACKQHQQKNSKHLQEGSSKQHQPEGNRRSITTRGRQRMHIQQWNSHAMIKIRREGGLTPNAVGASQDSRVCKDSRLPCCLNLQCTSCGVSPA
jgi:hypothetical protein